MLSFPINENSRGRQWAFYGHHKDSAVRRKIENNTNIGRQQNWAAMGEITALPVLPAVFGSFLITVASALLAIGHCWYQIMYM